MPSRACKEQADNNSPCRSEQSWLERGNAKTQQTLVHSCLLASTCYGKHLKLRAASASWTSSCTFARPAVIPSGLTCWALNALTRLRPRISRLSCQLGFMVSWTAFTDDCGLLLLLLLLLTHDADFGLGVRKPTFAPLLGSGIFTQDGPGWKHSRDLLRHQFDKRRFQQRLRAWKTTLAICYGAFPRLAVLTFSLCSLASSSTLRHPCSSEDWLEHYSSIRLA